MKETKPSRSRFEPWLIAAAVAFVLTWYAYATSRASGVWVRSEPDAYYELLTEAVLDGRTHLSLQPDPRLAQLENPWGGAQGIPRAHDATYFNGKYYLYFGVAPVILLLAPWRLITGTYLTDGAAIGVFIAVGYLLSVWFFLRCRRRFFGELSSGWTVLVVLVLGLGSFLHYNIWNPQFYQVPIASAFVCGTIAAHGVLSAAIASGRRAAVFGLGLASLAWGCAVGSRPNFIVGLLPLGLATLALWWAARRDYSARSSSNWLLLAGVGPAALVGVGLAAYNYARFGNIFEFGLSYQFAAIDMRGFKLVGLQNVGPALHAYLLAPPSYSLYYPFIRPAEESFGLLTWAPFSLWVLAVPVLALHPRWRGRAWGVGVGFGLAAGAAVFGSLLIYSYLLERYELDFTAWFMLVALLGASGALVWVRGRSLAWRIAVCAAVALPLAWTAVHSFVHSWPPANDWAEVRALARVANRVSARLENWFDWRHGPAEFTVEMPNSPVARPEPVFATAQGRDVVYVERVDLEHYRFGFAHQGLPGVLGEPLVARSDQSLRLRLDLGGLYPPRDHPAFASWGPAEIERLRRRVEVQCEGRVVLRAESPFYSSDPLDLRMGESRISWLAPRFTGHIGTVVRAGMPTPEEVSAGLGSGAVRLRLKFPRFTAMVGEPLISTGRPSAGDLVYAFYLGPGRLRFAHDSWSRDQLETEAVPFDPAEEHVVEVDFGALHAATSAANGGFRLHFDGREIVARERPYHPSTPVQTAFGLNAIGASTADVRFRGEKLAAERFVRLEAPPSDWGPIALTLLAPDVRVPGQAEPLIVTGRTGAGEFVYVRYLADGRACVGYDLWGVGGPESEPFAWAPGAPLLVQIALPALHPESASRWEALPEDWRQRVCGTVRVRVNGRVLLDAPTRSPVVAPAEIWVGENVIGGSTCGSRFTGQVLGRQRVDPVLGW